MQADRPDGFFQGRLKAFEVWLKFAGALPDTEAALAVGLDGGVAPAPVNTSVTAAAAAAAAADGREVVRRPLEELPVVLQILLSQVCVCVSVGAAAGGVLWVGVCVEFLCCVGFYFRFSRFLLSF